MTLSSASSSSRATPESTPPTSPPVSPTRSAASAKAKLAVPELPTAVIDGEAINPTMAARLTLCALGHVLFLKDQIPHPVGQLARLAARIDPDVAPSKSSKKLLELLDTYDLLVCHLHTTFDALSRALARNAVRYPPPRPTAKAHVMLALGQTLATARSRVVVELDGFEVKPYGRDDEDNIARSDPEQDDDELEPEEFYYEDELPAFGEDEDVDASSDEDEEEDGDDAHSAQARADAAAQEAALVQAERMLSRRINSVDSFYTEMGPTNTHVLLRAPRCFAHTEWVAQPRFQRVLDTHLAQRKDGVRVRCNAASPADDGVVDDGADESEEHEMIWWMWNGKLAGFTHP